MAIVEDYHAIAAELRRLRSNAIRTDMDRNAGEEGEPRHPMRRTLAGELLYRRLVERQCQ